VIGDSTGQMKVYSNIEGSNELTEAKSFKGHDGRIHSIKQSPFVETRNYVATSSSDKTVKVRDYTSEDWTLINTFTHSGIVYAMEWIDKDSIASCAEKETQIQIWNITTGAVINNEINTPSGSYVESLKILTNKIHLAVALAYPFDIRIYQISDGTQVGSPLQGHSSFVVDLFQLNTNTLISSSDDRSILIWDLTTHTSIFNLTGHDNRVVGLKQVTSSILASGSWDFTIKLWNTTTGNEIRTLANHTGSIYWSVDLLNPQTLISGSYDQSIKLWDWTTGECLSTTNTTLKIRSLTVLNNSNKNLSLFYI
jgi:WD40 repeat protein